MSRYTELRHAGYYQDGLSDEERQAIADQVDNGPARTETPKESTTAESVGATPKKPSTRKPASKKN